MSFADDDTNWDNDIVFCQALFDQKLANTARRTNIHARNPDKDLADAFARLGYDDDDYDDDDDDETDSTFISHHSDKLCVKERADSLSIPGLDDYMLSSPCPGVITRIGSHKQVMDDGDWGEDIKLPNKGLPATPPLKPVGPLFLTDEQEQPPKRKVRFDALEKVNTYTPEQSLEEDESYDDIGFPEDMSGLSIKRSSTPPPPHRMQPQSIHEDDDQDFGKDLYIDSDDVFRGRKRTAPRFSSIPRRVPDSKLPVASSLDRNPRFRAATYASRQRQTKSQMPPPKPALEKPPATRWTDRSNNSRMTAPNGTTLISTPRSKVSYGNGSELDGIDILPEWRRRSLSCWKHLTEKRLGGIDPQRPWRHNMSRRKPTLIRPDERVLNKECNEMRYDAEAQRWHGNEKSLSFFTAKQQRRRPALITNMNKKSIASRNAEVTVGSMVFDPVEMRWNTAPNVEEEEDVLAGIEDLGDFGLYRDQPSMRVRLPNSTREFELSRQMQRLCHDQEEEHYEQMKHWSLREDDQLFTPSNTPVRTHTYLLYH
ncbi:hypothetical protein BJV82DRAFT_14306 [Fennellomyces sp. T-0311]|nr:hypothetical protein BJV82DRAFT_14306 [Fennellomyces sp. T-0311]